MPREPDMTTVRHVGECGSIILEMANGRRMCIRPGEAVTVDWWDARRLEAIEPALLMLDLELERNAT